MSQFKRNHAIPFGDPDAYSKVCSPNIVICPYGTTIDGELVEPNSIQVQMDDGRFVDISELCDLYNTQEK